MTNLFIFLFFLFVVLFPLSFLYHPQFAEHCSSPGWPTGGWSSSYIPAAVAGTGEAY